MFLIAAHRLFLIFDGFGRCLIARDRISIQHATDLPLPTGPISPLTNALQAWKVAGVFSALYILGFLLILPLLPLLLLLLLLLSL